MLMGYENSAIEKTGSQVYGWDSHGSIAGVVEEHYELGRVIDIRRNMRDYINQSFEVDTISGGNIIRYMLRHYRSKTPRQKIRFEHAFLQKLAEKGFHCFPLLVTRKNGQTWSKVEEAFIAVFSYLEGEIHMGLAIVP